MRPYLKKTHHKERASEVAQGVSPEFKPQHSKKKKIHFILQIHMPESCS
jgi:hypothetical protein